jgi:hypothetical protein
MCWYVDTTHQLHWAQFLGTWKSLSWSINLLKIHNLVHKSRHWTLSWVTSIWPFLSRMFTSIYTRTRPSPAVLTIDTPYSYWGPPAFLLKYFRHQRSLAMRTDGRTPLRTDTAILFFVIRYSSSTNCVKNASALHHLQRAVTPFSRFQICCFLYMNTWCQSCSTHFNTIALAANQTHPMLPWRHVPAAPYLLPRRLAADRNTILKWRERLVSVGRICN